MCEYGAAPPSAAMLDKAGDKDFVTMYIIPALFCYAWQGWPRRCFHYLRHARFLLLCLARLALHILLLFASFPISFATLGKVGLSMNAP